MSTRRANDKIGSAKRKAEMLQVRINDAEKAAFTDAAELAGIALSAWVRERLRLNAARELEAASRPVAFLNGRKGGR
jgi:predicted HicB family RNase H-like nuclease